MQVLIAEDEQVSRHLLQRTLEKWDYDVVTVSNGSDAWEILRGKDAPRLAVLDWQMPGLDGVSLCRKVRNLEDTPYTYTILLTARSAVGDRPVATNAGPIKVTISIGATKATKGAKVDDVLARADSAMYQAKSQGRNRVCCVEPDVV